MKRLIVIAVLLLTTVSFVRVQSLEINDKGKHIPVIIQKIGILDGKPVVLLIDESKELFLQIFIGPMEALAIEIGWLKIPVERPLTHDLIGILLSSLGATVSKVSIHALRGNSTYYARITLKDVDGKEQEIDVRPSDALAIAARVNVPIYASRALMKKFEEFEGKKPSSPDKPGAKPKKPRHEA